MRKSVETPSLARRCLHYFFIFFPVFYIFPSAPPAQLTIRKAGRWTRRVLPRSWLVQQAERQAELQAGLLVGTV